MSTPGQKPPGQGDKVRKPVPKPVRIITILALLRLVLLIPDLYLAERLRDAAATFSVTPPINRICLPLWIVLVELAWAWQIENPHKNDGRKWDADSARKWTAWLAIIGGILRVVVGWLAASNVSATSYLSPDVLPGLLVVLGLRVASDFVTAICASQKSTKDWTQRR